MATVALSRDRRNIIQRHITTMALADLEQELGDYKEVSNVDASRLITLLQFQPHYELVDQIPQSWLVPIAEHYREIHVLPREPQMVTTQNFYGPVTSREKLTPLFTVKFPDSKTAYWRPANNTAEARRTEVSAPLLRELSQDPAFQDIPGMAQLLTNLRLLDAVNANREKWTKIEAQLTALLGQVKTLNGAVRAFPNLRFYLPSDMLTLLDKPVTNGPKKVVDTSSLDLDTLTAAGVTAALSKGIE